MQFFIFLTYHILKLYLLLFSFWFFSFVDFFLKVLFLKILGLQILIGTLKSSRNLRLFSWLEILLFSFEKTVLKSLLLTSVDLLSIGQNSDSSLFLPRVELLTDLSGIHFEITSIEFLIFFINEKFFESFCLAVPDLFLSLKKISVCILNSYLFKDFFMDLIFLRQGNNLILIGF